MITECVTPETLKAWYRKPRQEWIREYLKIMKDSDFNAVDLFAGAGGITEGLKLAGFRVVLANDMDRMASAAHRRNHPEVPFVERDIAQLRAEFFKELCNGHKINLVTGGPPCQGFSMNGDRNVDDPRNMLFKHYVKILKILNPEFFVMENVRGVLSMENAEGGLVIDDVMTAFRKLSGYTVGHAIINMADYGVPQRRERVFFIGNRLGVDFLDCIPAKTHGPETSTPYITSGDAIMDLVCVPDDTIPNHKRMKHSHIVKDRMSLIKEGKMIPKEFPSDKQHLQRKNYQTVYRRIDRNKPSPTMVPGHMAFPVHPTEDRSLTVREAARLQTFPDSFEFLGGVIDQGLQAGNAVPPIFVMALGNHIKRLIRRGCHVFMAGRKP